MDKKRWINTQPEIVNARKRLGDWEGDTVVGKHGTSPRLLTYTERKSGKAMAIKLPGGVGQAEAVIQHLATKEYSSNATVLSAHPEAQAINNDLRQRAGV